MSTGSPRPVPDALLQSLKRDEAAGQKGSLKIFFGMCAGVGKTYDMLTAAREARAKGVDVVVGYVETHGRRETEDLLAGLPIVPRKSVDYRGTVVPEMDIDAILARKPALVLVDELAHTNAPGSRHAKRYQDVLELLASGIDVFTTLNVQHLESRADTVAQITGSIVRETVPDSIFESADSVAIVDVPPDELLKRLADGKVYTPERSREAVQHFFRPGNLTALREMALRLVAERVDHQLRDLMRAQRIPGPWKSGQRLIVGISSSPNSVKLIRWARRTAYTMDASWVAVHVETARPPGDQARDRLAMNIKLAQELGAEIISTADEDIADGILRVAREQNGTQILVGKPERRFRLRAGMLDRLIERSGDLDIYVVGGDEAATGKSRSPRLPEIRSGIRQYLFAALVMSLVTLALYPLRDALGYQSISMFLLLTLVLLPLKLDAGPVLLAAAVSAVAWDFFFIPPQFTFAIGQLQDVLMFCLYFGVAAVTGVLTARIRSREKILRTRERHASAMYDMTRELAGARSQDDVVSVAVRMIRKYFEADVAVLLSQADGDISTAAHPAGTFPVDGKEFAVAAWTYWNERKAGRYTDTLPSAGGTYYPLSGPRYPLGVVGVRRSGDAPWSFDQEHLFQSFIRQLASALEREQLNEMTKRSIVIAESEKLYNTVFSSLSHELRTPVAAILAAADTLQGEQRKRGSELERDLLGEISSAAGRLDRLVQNLLDVTRLESGLLRPRIDWSDARDVITKAVEDVTSESGRAIGVTLPDGECLVRADFGLLVQSLANVLRNAATYTPAGTPIDISAGVQGSDFVITIEDSGPGFPGAALPHIFEKFYRVEGTGAGGT
ncbi:MAG: Osmosensitive channel signal transduction histidine kinase, partial [Bacteroidetes bacterium]|nr:Osmosensitive channel signal transduction histidine kinase [Bacteroidota bacterium]